jgi:hypothetical protein
MTLLGDVLTAILTISSKSHKSNGNSVLSYDMNDIRNSVLSYVKMIG